MPHSFGKRARTRDLFCRPFRKAGTIAPASYLRTFKRGQIVDVKANGAVQRGMPHKFYHGKTGVIFNVTKRSVGLEMNKKVEGRILKKRFHVRIEHVSHSDSRQDFLNRVKANDEKRKQAKAEGIKERVVFKRQPVQPREQFIVKMKNGRVPAQCSEKT